MNKIQKITIFIGLSISFSMNSQPIELPELGIQFEIPAGWSGGEEGDYIILGHNSIPGLMILTQNKARDAHTLKNQAEDTILEEGVFLEADGDFVIVSETRVEGNYKGTYQGQEVKAYAIGLINTQGTGMNILILTAPDAFSKAHIEEANKLARSVKFAAPKDSDNTLFWKERITGVQLKYMHTSGGSDYSGGYSGISDVVMINLCSNGQFTYYSNAHSSFDASGGFGSANARKDTGGNYEIYSQGKSTYLDLQFENGDVKSFELTVNSERHTLLNGSRYAIINVEGCE